MQWICFTFRKLKIGILVFILFAGSGLATYFLYPREVIISLHSHKVMSFNFEELSPWIDYTVRVCWISIMSPFDTCNYFLNSFAQWKQTWVKYKFQQIDILSVIRAHILQNLENLFLFWYDRFHFKIPCYMTHLEPIFPAYRHHFVTLYEIKPSIDIVRRWYLSPLLYQSSFLWSLPLVKNLWPPFPK